MACPVESTYGASRDHNDDAEGNLAEEGCTGRATARRAEVERLIALALDQLDEENEQIVRDYLGHAIAALRRIPASEGASPA